MNLAITTSINGEADKQLFCRFVQLLNEKYIEYSYADLFANALQVTQKKLNEAAKKETGKTAQEYIQSKLIDVAKEKVFDRNKSVSEIAYELGFKYPQHFTRLFKQRVGQSPNEYRNSPN